MTKNFLREKDGLRRDFLGRTEALLGAPCLERFARARVAVAGLGGVGGAMLPILARLGIGRFRIADPGLYDAPDMNRQWGATLDTIGENKTAACERFVRSVNPDAEVETFAEGVTERNLDAFLEGADLAIDALDLNVDPALRRRLADQARQNGIWNISSPIIGFGALIVTAAPDGMPMDAFMKYVADVRTSGQMPPGLRKFFSASHLGIIETSLATRRIMPSLAPAPALAAALAATEAAMILGGQSLPGWRPPVCLPNLIAADMARMRFGVMRVGDLGRKTGWRGWAGGWRDWWQAWRERHMPEPSPVANG